MTEERYAQSWTTLVPSRTCGSCYACCTWLGIEELRKYAGQPCKHLGPKADPTKRCTIYEHRPIACAKYQCLWREGWGPEELKPETSGILLTPYPSEDPGDTSFAITALIFDARRARPHIDKLIREALSLAPNMELRLVDCAKRTALFFKNGEIFNCTVMPSKGFESLDFRASFPRIGTYRIAQVEEAKP